MTYNVGYILGCNHNKLSIYNFIPFSNYDFKNEIFSCKALPDVANECESVSPASVRSVVSVSGEHPPSLM